MMVRGWIIMNSKPMLEYGVRTTRLDTHGSLASGRNA